MIIQILCNLMEDGYQQKGRDAWISPFFSGANVAFRREALNNIGAYDQKCVTGEDRDVCLRLASDGWEMYFEPRAKVGHKNRLSARSLVRQWFGYGFHHPYVAKKHSSSAIRIYRPRLTKGKDALYKILLQIPFPLSISIFLTPFLVMHSLFGFTVLLAALGIYAPSIVTGVATLITAILYFKSDLKRKNIVDAVAFVVLRYMANFALLIGGLLGGAKLRMFYIGATFDYKG